MRRTLNFFDSQKLKLKTKEAIKLVKKKKYSIYHAVEHHEKRSNRSKGADESKTAKKTRNYPTKDWYKNPDRSDVVNIDTKKAKAKNVGQAIGFLQSVTRTSVPKKNVKQTSNKKAIITHPKASVKTLQKTVNVHFNNVKVYKRKKRGRPKDFWISVLKK